MLRSIKELLDYRVISRDDELGAVDDFVFDDVEWAIRYIQVNTDNWLPGRRVLLPPSAAGQPIWADRVFPMSLTRRQIEASPTLIRDERISRAHEADLHGYYGWQPYWAGGVMSEPARTIIDNALGPGRESSEPPPPAEYSMKTGRSGKGDVRDRSLADLGDEKGMESRDTAERPRSSRPHGATDIVPNTLSGPELRSLKVVLGYHVQATDGELGHVEDFIVDDDNWAMRYVVVDTRNWLPGRKVLLAVFWANSVDWENKKLSMDLSRETIKNSPEFDPSVPINRQYEEVFFDYYGRPKYWL